ncbi:MAG: Glycosyl hydrolase 36 superfamily [Promethearchaeota archaeon]|nr:MAG: Glycosyl hydrolase 36 superfamily [Candidatus Lokiarchaeota archaeon]
MNARNNEKPYGSGYFGRWIEDRFGAPAYRYECNQLADPRATTPMNELWREKTDHYFLVGNDRIAGVASNYGYIKIRQDEGSPKYLNYYLPELHQYAGGFGYLTDGVNLLTTYYSEPTQFKERIFGMGYCRKTVSNANYSIDQRIFAPFGDDPVVISQVSFTNQTDTNAELSWFEYWGCFNFQFSFQAVIQAIGKQDQNLLKKYRVESEKKFKNRFILLDDNRGLFNMKFNPSSRNAEQQKDFDLRKRGIQIGKKKPIFEDRNPPPIFLISLDGPIQGCYTDAQKFFGNGGVSNPRGVSSKASFNIQMEDFQSCMVLRKDFELKPKETKTLIFMYGYIPEGFGLNDLIEKYTHLTQTESVLMNTLEAWKSVGPKLEVEGEKWVSREILWHYYYLRGGLTYDDFFMEHILSQGHIYQYLIGFQGAARDPPQHAMPFLYTDPEIAKEIIRYTFKETKKNGKIPYGITGNGAIMPSPWEPSDTELWVLWLTANYVLSSKDPGFLEEEIPLYPIYKKSSSTISIKEFLKLIYRHFTENTGKGEHGLQRVASCDWNDLIISGFVPDDKLVEVKKKGESVLNSAMAAYVLPLFATLMEYVNEEETAQKARDYANDMKDALREQWNGKWLRRAWLTDAIGWVGDDILWLEPQPWAIISEALDDEKKKVLVKNIDKKVRQPSELGAILQSEVIENENSPPGMGNSAGIWPSINGTLIWALRKVDPEMAWDEYKKNLLAYHAETYPEIWYGIWSGPDTINSVFSEFPGHTIFNKFYLSGDPKDKGDNPISTGINWTDFPVLNLHPHAWPLYNILHLLGIEFTQTGIKICLDFPKTTYEFSSPLVGLKKTHNGYSGWYNPKTVGKWTIELQFKGNIYPQVQKLLINEQEKEFQRDEHGIVVRGKNVTEKGLHWKLTVERQY